MSYMPFDSLPDPTDKFELLEELGTGFCAKVYKAKDLANNRNVAIKIQPYDQDHQEHIEEEYRVLRDYSSHDNLPDFYGAFRAKNSHQADDIWFILEYCEGGTIVELVNRLLVKERRMKEEHIAFILREVGRAATELHRNHFIHRDIRGSNILLTKNGEVKLCDFGLTREVDSTFGKRGTCIGSPCWMSPETVMAQDAREREVYGSRIDVWALGITGIELADGKPPFFDMHPTRAMFQIVRNPPPTVYKPSNWSQNLNDFIAECLEKNPENRPFMMEIVEHPFLTELPENDFALQQEIKHLIEVSQSESYVRPQEISVDRGFIKKYNSSPEKMFTEDLAAIENPAESIVLDHLANRIKMGQSYSFIGDILLSLNSNDLSMEYSDEQHEKYKFKSRSENAPHIFAVSDLAYQDMLHHKEPQHVVFSGESYSGKTTNVRLFINHLFYLGGGNKGATDRVNKSMRAIEMLTNAGTPLNNDSTRCFMQYQLTFGSTGKMSGAVFNMLMLEKMRVSTTDMNQHNFHIFYYFYDFIAANGKLNEFFLEDGRNYRYLRIPKETQTTKLKYPRDDVKKNVEMYREFEDTLVDLDISRKNLETIKKILSAILNIGNLRFKTGDNKYAEIEDADVATKIADLLRIDDKKFQWALVNYCKVKGGIAERRQYSTEQARDARDALAATIYHRLVNWIINKINMNLSFPRAVFGDVNAIVVYDLFGFECFHRNGIEQLMINSINEQMQYHYNQKMFASEMFEQEADGIPITQFNFYDNKQTLDHILTKPEGLFCIIDEASRQTQDHEFITGKVSEKKSQFLKKHSAHEISVAHYTGKIIYDTRAFADINRDFVPPEMIESLRTSLDESIVLMFSNQLSKCGSLTMAFENIEHKKGDSHRRTYNLNTLSIGQYSQVTNLRTLSTVFRCTCLDILKNLSGSDSEGTHFVRCIRADLDYKPRNFHPEMVQQQMKALGVMDTINARQKGYSCRISFQEFLKRYQFLAFDFDETVDMTKDNCRLLLIRLKMEGWAIGKSKVFLRYYNDEYLARLYEIQVKKIIKVQSMMRSYIARRKVQQKQNPGLAAVRRPVAKQSSQAKEPDDAAITIQKAFRGYKVRQKYGPIQNEKTGQVDASTVKFVKSYAKRWRAKSIFQVLLHYRAARFMDLVNFSQQVHLYNQRVVATLHQAGRGIQLEKIDPRQTNCAVFGLLPLPVRKIPFRFDQLPYFDTVYMCDHMNPTANITDTGDDAEEHWDAPLQKNPSLTSHLMTYNAYKKEQAVQTSWDKIHESDAIYQQSYNRDPNANKRNSSIALTRNDIRTSEYMTRNIPLSPMSPMYFNGEDYHSDYRRPSYNQSGSGSRRNSLKKRPAPTPPPPPPTWNRPSNSDSSYGRKDFRPPNPIQELEMLGKRGHVDIDQGDDPPFNFKAMLRKTNYSRPENNNVEYNSRQFDNHDQQQHQQHQQQQQQSKFGARLKPTEQRYGGESSKMASSSSKDYNYNKKPAPTISNLNDTNATSFKEAGTYIEEEIAPGITLAGYAINI